MATLPCLCPGPTLLLPPGTGQVLCRTRCTLLSRLGTHPRPPMYSLFLLPAFGEVQTCFCSGEFQAEQ